MRLTDEQVSFAKTQSREGLFDQAQPGITVALLRAIMADREALVAECDNWIETARQHHKNEEYYRALVIKVGELIGPRAFISDDGSVQKDVLCAKVPELVWALVDENKKLRRVVDVVRVDIDDGFAVSDNLRAAFYALEPKEAANAQDKADD